MKGFQDVLVQGMASDRQTQCNRLVVTCTEDVVQDVLVRLETRTVCQDVLMKNMATEHDDGSGP